MNNSYRNGGGYPYPYYGNQGSYPQYKGLTSGINMMTGDAIPQGISSLQDSLLRLKQTDTAKNDALEAKFNELVDADIKDVKGRFRDEAVIKRDAFINAARDFAKEDQGKLTWEHIKKIESMRGDLESFVSMYGDVQDWAKTSNKAAVGIKDDVARRKTAENINKILREGGDLQSVWNSTQGNEWLVHPERAWDWKNELYKQIPKAYTKTGVFDLKKAEAGILNLLETNDKITTEWYERESKKNPDLTVEQFAKKNALMAKNWASTKKDYTNDSSVKTPYDKIQEFSIKADEKGTWRFGDLNKGKGVPIGTIDNPDDPENAFNGAEIIAVKMIDGKPMAVIRHDVAAKNDNAEQKAAMIEMFGEEDYSKLVAIGKGASSGEKKDRINKGLSFVPYDQVAGALERNKVTLDGFTTEAAVSKDEAAERESKKNKWASSKRGN